MKKQEEKKHKVNPSEMALHYLYIVAMDGTCVKLKAPALNDMDYLLGKLKKMTGSLTIYGKAKAAVILALNYDYKTAEFVPIVAASVISTVLVLAVTGWVHQCYGKAKDKIKGETKE